MSVLFFTSLIPHFARAKFATFSLIAMNLEVVNLLASAPAVLWGLVESEIPVLKAALVDGKAALAESKAVLADSNWRTRAS